MNAPLVDKSAYKGDLPGSRRGQCLGCGELIVLARHAHVRVVGKRDGSVVVFVDAEPQRSLATDVDRMTEPGMFLLGVSHRHCTQRTIERLQKGEVNLPRELPRAVHEEVGDEEPPLPPLHLPPSGDLCPFCGGADLTDEHVFPKWISKLFSERGWKVGGRLEQTVKVCSSCNHRWLSVLEQRAQQVLVPMISGEPSVHLTTDDQRTAATWAAKTAMMLDLASDEPVVPLGFYHELRQRREPPAGQVVFAAAYSGSRWAARADLKRLEREDEPVGFACTFNVFRAVFQVCGSFVREAEFHDRRPIAAGLLTIWPTKDKAVSWPRSRLAFHDDDLVRLGNSVD